MAALASPKPASHRHRRHSVSSVAGSSSSRCSVSRTGVGDTQANLLRGRGDLSGAKLYFDVSLQSPIAATKNPLRGIGVQLLKGAPSDSRGSPQLSVKEVAEKYRGMSTSAGHWNDECCKHHRAMCTLKPGDRVCSVNGLPDSDYDGMLEELAHTTTPHGTHSMRLSVERELSHVLAPPQLMTKFHASSHDSQSTVDPTCHGEPGSSSRILLRKPEARACFPHDR